MKTMLLAMCVLVGQGEAVTTVSISNTETSTMSSTLPTGTDSMTISLPSSSVSSSLSIATRTETFDPTIPMHSFKFKIRVKDSMSYDAGSTGSIAVHFVKEGHPTWYWGSLSGLAAGEAQTYHVNGSPYSFSEIDNVVLIAFMSTTDNLMVEAILLQHIASGFWKRYLVREPKQLLCCGEEMVETWYPTC